jgi:aspartate kinase
VVSDPLHIASIDLAMLQEMAESGAKVLNAQAVEWARKAKVVLHARKTSDPLDATGKPPRETIAHEREACGARAIVGLDKVVAIRARAQAARVLADAAADLEIPLLDLAVAGGELSAAIPLLNVPDWERRRVALDARTRGALAFVQGRAIVSVVGDGLTTGSRALPRFLASLASIGVNGDPEGLVAGPLRIGMCIDAELLAPAQRALHDEFVG